MATEGYNGYSNYETWNVCLWYGNDEPLYQLKEHLRKRSHSVEHFAEVMEATTLALAWEKGGKFGDLDTPEELGRVDWLEAAESMSAE